jgi:hypothetical protein
MDEKHWYAMIERMQRMIEHLEEVEERLEVSPEPIVVVDSYGTKEFRDVDEMADYYARRMNDISNNL